MNNSTELSFAIDLAKQAGAIMKKNFSLGMKKEWKSDKTPLTVTDLAINDLVVHALVKRYPDYSLITEEAGHDKKDSEYTWICDPLDGTIPFSHSIPTFVFSLALAHNGNPIMGVVYDPILDRLYTAEKHKGAFMNGNEIRVSKTSNLHKGLVIYDTMKPNRVDLNLLLRESENHGVHFASLKSSIYSAMFVAIGEIPASIYGANKPWDSAAVKIIVDEAGGKVTDLAGKDQKYDEHINGFIASNGVVHAQIVELVQSAMKR